MTRRKPDSQLKVARPVRRTREEMEIARANGSEPPRKHPGASGHYQLMKLLEIQAQLLDRALTDADILRWRLLDMGMPISELDRPPFCSHPETGRKPPEKPVSIGIGFSAPTPPPRPFSVVPACEMSPDNFRRHMRYRHRDKQDATIGIHEWLHLTGKTNHVHSEPEGKKASQNEKKETTAQPSV